LLEGESSATTHETSHYDYNTEGGSPDSNHIQSARRLGNYQPHPLSSGHTGSGGRLRGDAEVTARVPQGVSYGQRNPSIASPPKDEADQEHTQGIPVHDQRTILIANLPGRTTHKDLAGVIRGGRLLDIFLRTDRTATVSFVEGAAEFLAYTKRTDVYLHAKRVSNESALLKHAELTIYSLHSAGLIANFTYRATYPTRFSAVQRETL
jgi:hypothetical protein